MKQIMIIFALLCAGTICLGQDGTGAVMKPSDCQCGDVNCDGNLDWADGVYLLNYLFGGGPVPLTADLDHADWDNRQLLTINDIVCTLPIQGFIGCPPAHPPWNPQLDTLSTTEYLYYTNRVRPGVSHAAVSLTFRSTDIMGFSFPLRMRIDGHIPVIDSVVYSFPTNHLNTGGAYAVYADSGCLAFGAQTILISPQMQFIEDIATIYVTVLSAPAEQPVTMEWVHLTPLQAPAIDSSVWPMVVRNAYEKSWPTIAFQPILKSHCCITPGDVNDDGAVNVGDAVYLVNYVFRQGPPPPCESQANANVDSQINIGDAIYLINYIFRGGPAPQCM